MEKRTRLVDAKARTTLFPDFAGAKVTIERISANELRVCKVRPRKRTYSLRQLVDGITRKNRHEEVSTGQPVAREVW